MTKAQNESVCIFRVKSGNFFFLGTQKHFPCFKLISLAQKSQIRVYQRSIWQLNGGVSDHIEDKCDYGRWRSVKTLEKASSSGFGLHVGRRRAALSSCCVLLRVTHFLLHVLPRSSSSSSSHPTPPPPPPQSHDPGCVITGTHTHTHSVKWQGGWRRR